ncbi:MAG: hypothetical protein QGI68_17640 [Pseudomonadales bacterium]|nr:hypothetical protein [Pseudomonadales bacterium]MDP7597367.1 hypothetical protein [Pseudomonadales bacterium]HJN51492.1 hypothetical protein [Pseudomonadales bacterium]|tara:strand:+ start:9431 stop:9739 length:309 start_codon:yes stop_codon:yes gene_type:complete
MSIIPSQALPIAIISWCLVACGGGGGGGSSTPAVAQTPQNSPPTANAGADSGLLLSNINFADDALAQCVADTGLTHADEVTELICWDSGISDAAGIEELASW